MTTLFRKKTSHNGSWDQSGTLNVCLSGGLTTLDHTHTNGHTHTYTHCQAVSGQSITQNKALKPRVKPDRPCERVIVCEGVCAFVCACQSDDCGCSKRMISGPAGSQAATAGWTTVFYCVDYPE